MRDTIVYALHLQQLPEGAERTAGWMQDPYDPTRDDKLMRNRADDEQHDRKFPEHPLTLLRAELERLLPSVS